MLLRAGKQAKQTAGELGIHLVTLSSGFRQDDIDSARSPGVPSSELRAARRCIRELETELLIVRQAVESLAEDRSRPEGSSVIEDLADAGIPIDRCCGVLGVPRRH